MNTPLSEIADTQSTIAAISTPPGIGGIAVARISGDDAITIADRIWHGRKPLSHANTHTAHYGTIIDTKGQTLDQAVATIFRAPQSYTGQDTVEIAVHGSQYVQRELINTLIAAGARLAHPGEYTRRAFTNGRLNLTEAEAIADVISSTSRAAHRLAVSQLKGNFARDIEKLRTKLIDLLALLELELDFSEEDIQFADRNSLRNAASDIYNHVNKLAESYTAGNAIKNGIPIAIIGATNAGKSSLLNTLIGDDRAIVSNIHGTTRDTIEETLEIDEFLYRFIDTAGLRNTTDPIEQLGIQRSHKAIQRAIITILVIDQTTPIDDQTKQILKNPPSNLITVLNKTDIANTDHTDSITNALKISTKTGEGIHTLRKIILDITRKTLYPSTNTADTENTIVTNARHAQSLQRASQTAKDIINGIDNNLSGDLIAMDARATINALSEITGQITSDQILAIIFSRFCIGK